MGSGFFVRLREESPSIDIAMDGHALAVNENSLSTRCEELRVTPILAFLCPDGETQRGVLDSHGLYDLPASPERWFQPAEGLKTLDSLIPVVEREPEWFIEPETLLRDLYRLREILLQAAAAGVEWNLDAEL